MKRRPGRREESIVGEGQKRAWVQETLLSAQPLQSPVWQTPVPTVALPSPAPSRPRKRPLTLEGSSLTPDQRLLLPARPPPAA